MHTIRRLIIDFILIAVFCCSLGLSATETIDTESSTLVSQEMCMDELFQASGNINQSVLRTHYVDNGVEVKYEVVVTPSGEAYILKDNLVKVKTLSYTSGDYFSAKLRPAVLEIYQNTTLVFSQEITPTTIYKTVSSIIESKLKPVEMDYIDGFCGGNTKCATPSWGNAGFVSKNVLKQGDDGEIRWTVQEIDKYKMLGLGAYTTSKYYKDFNYAVYQSKSQMKIYELGINKATKSGLKIGDVLSIKNESGQIKYYLNDQLIYTSTVSVSQDLHVLGDIYSIGGLIQNVEASFTQNYELYTMSSVYYKPRTVKWNKLSHYISDSKTANILSKTGNSSALSEQFYQDDLGDNPVLIKPDLQILFEEQFRETELSVAIGVKTYEDGLYLEREVSLDQMLSGFVFERTREGKPRLFIRDGGQLINIEAYDQHSKYQIRLEKGRMFFEKESEGKYQQLYSRNIDPSTKHLVYQGAGISGSPFLNINIDGFKDVGFITSAYNYEGEDDLLTVLNGDIFNVISQTGQSQIKHKVSWINLTNIKGGTKGSTLRSSVELEDINSVGYGESIFRFSPLDQLSTEFVYKGGDLELGVKSILANTSKTNVGVKILSGKIMVLNPKIQNLTDIKSGDLVGMHFLGNGSLNVTLNGASLGSAQMPHNLFNFVFQVSNGGSISVSNFFNLQWGGPTIPYNLGEPNIIQSTYRSDCSVNISSTLKISNTGSAAPPIQFEITDLNTGLVVHTSSVSIAQNSISNYTFSLPLGVYEFSAFYHGRFHYQIFEVTTPIRWNDAGSAATQVVFDAVLYNQLNSVSSLELEEDAGDSFSRSLNVVQHGTFGSYILPIDNANKGIFEYKLTGFTDNGTMRFYNETGSLPEFRFSYPNGLTGIYYAEPFLKAFKIRLRPASPTSPLVYVDFISVLAGGNEVVSYSASINLLNLPQPLDSNAYFTVKSHSNEVTPFKFIQSLSTVCPNDPPVPLVLSAASFGYGRMKRAYDANFYVAKGELRFQFTEDYYIGSQGLNYNLYDIYSDVVTGCAYNPMISMGDNRYMLDLDNLCSGLTLNQQYRLEVQNSKGDKRVLRFLYTN